MFLLRYTAKPDPHHQSDQDRLDPEPGRTTAICEVAEPLVAGLTEYPNPACGQSRFRRFFAKSFLGNACVSLAGCGVPAATDFLCVSKRAVSNCLNHKSVRNLDRHLPPGASAVSLFWLLDYVPDVERGRTVSINLFHQTVSDSANFFGGLLGANIIFADQQHNALHKLEGMIQH